MGAAEYNIRHECGQASVNAKRRGARIADVPLLDSEKRHLIKVSFQPLLNTLKVVVAIALPITAGVTRKPSPHQTPVY